MLLQATENAVGLLIPHSGLWCAWTNLQGAK